MQDQTLYGRIRASGILRDREFPISYGIEGITVQYFDTALASKLATSAEVSGNFRAHFGDFSSFQHPRQLDNVFGPSQVLNISLNTGDRSLLERTVTATLEELEKKVPPAKRGLSYVGILYCDNDLIFAGEQREVIGPILRA